MNKISTYIRMLGLIVLSLMCSYGFANTPGFDSIEGSGFFFRGGGSDVEGARGVIVTIFRSVSIVLFVVALFVAVLSTIRLLASESADEESWKRWRTTLIWSLAGLFLLTIAHRVILSFDTGTRGGNLDVSLGVRFVTSVVYPVLAIMQFLAAVAFLFAAIYSFYRIITAGGEEAGVKAGRQSFLNSIIGFILVLVVKPLISVVYAGSGCGTQGLFGELEAGCQTKFVDTVEAMSLVERIITFLNGFVAVIVLIMVIYAGVMILTSNGDEERIGKGRKAILFSIIGIVYLVLSYLIFTFFVFQI